MFKHLAPVISFLMLIVEGQRQWHTSQVSLSELYEFQDYQFQVLKTYLDMETTRLEYLENYSAEIHELRDNKQIKNTYKHNFINAVKVITRFSRQINGINYLTNNEKSIEALKNMDEHLSDDHITLASLGLRRIQQFYGIPASDMAAGRYNDQIIGDEMNACECYIMSIICFENVDVYGGISWANQTFNKFERDGRPKCVDTEILSDYLTPTAAWTGFTGTTLSSINELHYSDSEKNAKLTEHNFLMKDDIFTQNEKNITIDRFDVSRNFEIEPFDKRFKTLCKHGESLRTLTKDSKCRYQTKNSYYRMLMPFKEEDVSSDPFIKLYHDVIYDNEIMEVKSYISNYLKDTKIINPSGKSIFAENKRSGQVGWLSPKNLKSISLNSLIDRIELFTGLTTKTSENFQIVNYGLAGHYTPHHDAFARTFKTVKTFGNRYATVLFYMSDVLLGGHTTFPLINVVSPAKKGTALVWYNLIPSNGLPNNHTIHGSCPILCGNKWIMTKWLREEGQNLPYDWKLLSLK